jgi:cation-transporting ATPase E
LPAGLHALGLISLKDELRPEAKQALEAFIALGVRPKIISGDNPETVAALARQAGLTGDLTLVTGLELDALDDSQLAAIAEAGSIFGRITPQQKERLVQALRAQGHYVAMIGDGVNDVLSLKQANLGIAMHSGSQATRGVADIVLMQDSFAALVPAVAEGRRILNGMQDILKLYLTRITAVGVLIVSSLVVGVFPLALRNGSAVTFFTVGVPTVALALWAQSTPLPRESLMIRLFHFVGTAVLITSALGLLLFYGVLAIELAQLVTPGVQTIDPIAWETARAHAQSALTAFLIFTGLLLVIFVEPPSPWWTGGDVLSGDWRPTLLALGLMLAFVVLMLVPPLRGIFALSPLSGATWLLSISFIIVWLFVVRFLWRVRALTRLLQFGKSS